MSDVAGAASSADVVALVVNPTMTGRWVLDGAGSSVEFHIRHFWGAITVHGSFGHISGEAAVGADGAISCVLTIDASSLRTKNKQRDGHLRSADFFDVASHPNVTVTVTGARPAGPAVLACTGTMEAAGQVQPLTFTALVEGPTAESVVLRAEVTIRRTGFGMTWRPLRIAAPQARAAVVARFVRPDG
jgi:polyisoprenoid-binding protein YceI